VVCRQRNKQLFCTTTQIKKKKASLTMLQVKCGKKQGDFPKKKRTAKPIVMPAGLPSLSSAESIISAEEQTTTASA